MREKKKKNILPHMSHVLNSWHVHFDYDLLGILCVIQLHQIIDLTRRKMHNAHLEMSESLNRRIDLVRIYRSPNCIILESGEESPQSLPFQNANRCCLILPGAKTDICEFAYTCICRDTIKHQGADTILEFKAEYQPVLSIANT